MMRKRTLLQLGAILIIIGVVFSFFGIVEVWDGNFPQTEFQVSFLDNRRRPIKGVTLAVTDHKGALAYGYPVTDYREDSVPSSNNDGLMIFHHVTPGTEFGGKCRWLFYAIPIGDCEAPKYTLRFLVKDRELAHYEYNEYLGMANSNWDSLPKINRQISEVGTSPESLADHLRIETRNLPPILEYHVIAKSIIVNEEAIAVGTR